MFLWYRILLFNTLYSLNGAFWLNWCPYDCKSMTIFVQNQRTISLICFFLSWKLCLCFFLFRSLINAHICWLIMSSGAQLTCKNEIHRHEWLKVIAFASEFVYCCLHFNLCWCNDKSMPKRTMYRLRSHQQIIIYMRVCVCTMEYRAVFVSSRALTHESTNSFA